MADDLDGWLAANEIYEGVPAIVQHLRSQGSFYIVTTKQVSVYSGIPEMAVHAGMLVHPSYCCSEWRDVPR